MVKAAVVKNPFKKPKVIKANKVFKKSKPNAIKVKPDALSKSSFNMPKQSPAKVKPDALSKSPTIKSKHSPAKVKPNVPSKRRFKKLKKVKEDRGVVLLSHIPHGFYEEQIEKYFSQFGHVTNVNLPRSKLGKSKGYAFVEFRHPEVAKVAAETMDNYLMMNRLMKAKYIAPEDQKPWIFKKVLEDKLTHSSLKEKYTSNLKLNCTLKNRKLSVDSQVKLGARLLKRAKAMHEKLQKLGVDYDFEVNKESLDAVFEKGTVLKEKKRKIEQNSGEDNDLVKTLELGGDSKSPELIISNKKIRLSTPKQQTLEKKKPTTDQTGSVKKTNKINKKPIVEQSPIENKHKTKINNDIVEETSSNKRKRKNKQSSPDESAVNTSKISVNDSNEEIAPTLNSLSTSLPIKKGKNKNKAQKINQSSSVEKVNLNESKVKSLANNLKEKKSLDTKKNLAKLSTSLPIKNTKKNTISESSNQTPSPKKISSKVSTKQKSNKNISLKPNESIGKLSTSLTIKTPKKKNKSENLNQTQSVKPLGLTESMEKSSIKKTSLKQKKNLEKLSTSLPIKNKKSKPKSEKSPNTKKKRASIGILPVNGRPEKSKNKIR